MVQKCPMLNLPRPSPSRCDLRKIDARRRSARRVRRWGNADAGRFARMSYPTSWRHEAKYQSTSRIILSLAFASILILIDFGRDSRATDAPMESPRVPTLRWEFEWSFSFQLMYLTLYQNVIAQTKNLGIWSVVPILAQCEWLRLVRCSYGDAVLYIL